MGPRLYLSRAGCALLLAWPADGWALAVHTGVLGDPRGGAAGAEAARTVSSLLRGSGIYEVVDPDVLRGRIGEPAEALFVRCGADVACWRAVGRAGGVEQLVLVERIDARSLGVRVLDVAGAGGFRQHAAPLGLGGGVDPELLDRLFFRSGGLRVVGAPLGAELVVDGRQRVPAAGVAELARLAAGKHTLELEAPGHVGWFGTAVVVPDTVGEVVVSLPVASAAPPRRLSRWTTWVGVAVVAGGAASVLVASEATGAAVTP